MYLSCTISTLFFYPLYLFIYPSSIFLYIHEFIHDIQEHLSLPIQNSIHSIFLSINIFIYPWDDPWYTGISFPPYPWYYSLILIISINFNSSVNFASYYLCLSISIYSLIYNKTVFPLISVIINFSVSSLYICVFNVSNRLYLILSMDWSLIFRNIYLSLFVIHFIFYLSMFHLFLYMS